MIYPTCQIIVGDALEKLREMPDESVQCCVTSPPYWRLRDYGVDGQIGLEETMEGYLERIVAVFTEVRRVLRRDGTCWVNMGDCYNTKPCTSGKSFRRDRASVGVKGSAWAAADGLKAKDLVGMPWRVAFALQADGWYLRSDIIWHKPNPMPESVNDRPTKAHEYLFLLSKSPKYYYDAEAIVEPCSENTHARLAQNVAAQIGSARANGGGKTNGKMKAVVKGSTKAAQNAPMSKQNESFASSCCLQVENRNKRTIWTVPTFGFSEAHFATFPPDLIKPCILAGSAQGDTVLDPFGGSGTTGMVAIEQGRSCILIELNPEYAALAKERVKVTPSFL